MTNNTQDKMDKLVSLCKRRGFVFSGSDIYGGLANTWDFGPLGVALKRNIKELWRKKFVLDVDSMYELDGGIILSPKIWEASGHVANFTDPLVECKSCHKRFRFDQIEDKEKCESCGGELTEPKMFNGMFRTFIGASEDTGSTAYLRPETAQAMFVNFKNILDSFHPKLPFGMAQVGKAFRNEITAGNFIFRDLEFEQMEIEYFVTEESWEKAFDFWLEKLKNWTNLIGLPQEKLFEREHEASERSHYSKKTVDIEYLYPFGRKELYGLAYRTDYDLRSHSEKSGTELKFIDDLGNKFTPHVIEPSMGVERTFLAVLDSAYTEDEKRVYLKLPAILSPVKIAVFPLVANKENIVGKAKEVCQSLKENFTTAWDERGNIGKRYLSQDEIGTPWCVTVDYQTLEDNTVTVRERDTTLQTRINIANLEEYFRKGLETK